MLSSYVKTSVIISSLPTVVNHCIRTFQHIVTNNRGVPNNESVVKRLMKLDLEDKLRSYEALLHEIDRRDYTDVVVIAAESVQEMILNVKDVLVALEHSLGQDTFEYITKLGFLYDNKEMIDSLSLYTSILDERVQRLLEALRFDKDTGNVFRTTYNI